MTTTAHILSGKALQHACGAECVDWATAMLLKGHDGEALVELAGMSPPHNHFELAPLRDRALVEVGAPDVGPGAAVETYAAELWRMVLAGDADLAETLATVKDLSLRHDHPGDLWDFYLLYHARDTLWSGGPQHYWEGATRETIDGIVLRRAEAFVAAATRRA